MSKSKAKKRTPDIVRKEAQDNLDKALSCFKAACEAVCELLALYEKMGTQQTPATPHEAVTRLATALGEAPTHVRRAAAEVRAEYGYKPGSEKQAKKPDKKQAKKPAKAAKPAKTVAAPTDTQAGREPEKKNDASRMGPHELTLNIGSQPVKELAENDAKDLLGNPKVFWYRPIQFPDPKRYHVQPRVLAAKVVERKSPKFTRSPWTVSVTLEARGDAKRCANWLKAVHDKNKADQE